ncbi:hemicentin-1-like [Sebastes umbrosus]|uniref:hemicentin-1-like n=1 Tax=Sebastes umbrosus TaxID=72105 RepID=UPI0018A0AA72|nr:hemicentin-1-like [Sebastes umbrosus]
MKLVALVCLCLVTRCGITAAGVNGPKVVEEGSDVILPCSLSTKENIQSTKFDWKKDGPRDDREVFLYDAGIHYNNGYPGQSETFKGRVSHFPDQLKYGNASIIIRYTKMTDSGNYTCDFPRLQPSQIFRVELIVACDLKDRTGENIPGAGAAPKPSVTSLKTTKYRWRLQCEVRGAFPEPKVEWQNSDGNILPAEKPQVSKSGDRYDVILQVTVTKTDYYRCVATQETICHQTYVYIGGPKVVEEGSDVILPCSLSTKQNITSELFDWKKDGPSDEREVFMCDAGIHYNNGRSGQSKTFKGRVSHFKDQLKYGNASITIKKTEVTDSGNYTCDFPRLQPHQIFRLELIVDRVLKDRTGENIPGAAPEPSVTSLDETKDWSRLQCKVRGASPEPKVEWQDSAGNILPAEKPQVSKSGDRYDVILQVTVNKTDYYCCVATQETISHQTYTKTYVYIHGQEVVKVFATEGSDVILPCSLSTKENIQSELFDWKKVAQKDDGQKEVFLYDKEDKYNSGRSGQSETFKGRVSHFPDQLKYGNASITITNTKVTDSGIYTCEFPRLKPDQKFYIELIFGAAPEPSVKTLDQTKDWSRLQCQVRGASPEPKVEWQDSDGNILPAEEPQVSKRGDRYDVILQVTVTKTDNYSCVATQETIKHRIAFDTYVYIGGAAPKPYVTSLDETKDWRLLQCEVHGNPEPKVEWQDSDGNILPAGETQTSERGGSFYITLQVTVTKTDRYRCVATQETISHQTYAETYVRMNGAAPEPSVTTLDQTEDGALLQCRVRGASPEPRLQWQDSDGNILTAEEPQVSERGGSYDVILQVTVTKTDRYRCVATQETISHQVYTETYVSVNGAAPEPSVTTLDQTEDGALLQCRVRGASPEPRLQWQDSDGNILTAEEPQVSERGGSYDVILQVTVTKTDRYRCVATQETISHQVYTETYVSVNGPGVVKVFAAEGSDVILPCSLSTKENIQSKLFDWRKDGRKDEREVFLYDAGVHYNNGRGGQSETFKGRVSHFQDQLKYGNASITIRNTRVTDRGNYTCHFPHLQPPQTFYIELVVDRDPQFSTLKNKNGETDGAAEPYISIVDITKVGVQLKCDIRGAFPQLKLQWRDSDGNVLPADEPRVSERGLRYEVTLQIIVNRTATNRFSCVVKQEDIGHMVDANFTVPEKLFEDVSCKGDVTGWIGGFFLGAFIILAVQALLVAAKLITIHRYKGVVKVFAAEGSDVILPCSLSTKENIQSNVFDWKKDGQKDEREVFLYDAGVHYNNGRGGQSEMFKGRVSHFQDQLEYGNASITIRNTRVTDRGNYTCHFPHLQPPQTFYIELVVGVVKVFATEGSDVILPCSLSTKENIQSKLFDWKKDGPRDDREVFLNDAGTHYNNGRSGQSETFKGRVSHFPDQLKYGNASITITNTKMTDSGNYTCHFPVLQPPQIFYVELVVEPILKDRSGENPAATPKPSVTILDATETWILLQCDVRGASLKPKVEWQDSAGNILPTEEPQVSERGGSYDIILQTTVTKNARYRCVVTQETISHQVSAETFVYISEKASSIIIGPFFGGLLLGAVIIGAVLALLVARKVITIRRYKGVVKVFAAEGSDVILPCSLSTKENIQSELFDWRKDGPRDDREVFLYDAGIHYNNKRSGQSEQFKGRVSHFPDQLKNGNASITITNTKMTDSGNYTCDFPRLQPRQIFYVELVVELIMKDRSGENPVATPKPSITILAATETRALLQCDVRGASPKPKVEWQDSAGNILPAEEPQVSERGGSYDVILNATVTKTDHYRCVVTQETIGHQVSAETFVHISAATPKPSVTTLDATETWTLLQCDVQGASLKPKVEWQDSAGNILPAEEPQVSERGGSYNIILNATVTKTDRYRCVVTQGTIGHQVSAETFVHISGKVSSIIIGSLFGGLLLGAVIIGAVLALLVARKVITIRRNKGSRLQRSGSLNVWYTPVNQTNGPVDQRNGLINQTNGPVDQTNGPVDQRNGLIDQTNGPVDQKNGPVDQGNGPVDQKNGPVDQGNVPVDQKNGPIDQRNGSIDQKNGLVDQKNGLVDQKNGLVDQGNS